MPPGFAVRGMAEAERALDCDIVDAAEVFVSLTAAAGWSNMGCLHCGFGQRILRPRNFSSTRNRKLHDAQQKEGFMTLNQASLVEFNDFHWHRQEYGTSDERQVDRL
jgi:hypothetical protein